MVQGGGGRRSVGAVRNGRRGRGAWSTIRSMVKRLVVRHAMPRHWPVLPPHGTTRGRAPELKPGRYYHRMERPGAERLN
eukprot:351154-Chlamydomonas_euryale.AAC.3